MLNNLLAEFALILQQSNSAVLNLKKQVQYHLIHGEPLSLD